MAEDLNNNEQALQSEEGAAPATEEAQTVPEGETNSSSVPEATQDSTGHEVSPSTEAGETQAAPQSAYVSFDEPAKEAARANRRRGLPAAILGTCACLALIIASLGFVYTPGDGSLSWSLSWIPEHLGLVSDAASDAVGDAGSAEDAKKSKDEASEEEADSADDNEDAEDANEENAGEESTSPSSETGGSTESTSSTGATTASSNTTSNADASASSSSGVDTSSNTGGGYNSGYSGTTGGNSTSTSTTTNSSSSSSAGTTTTTTTTTPQQPAPSNTVTISVSVSGGSVGASGTYTFNQGATAYDALCALGLSVNARNTQYGVYVAAIGGLAEKEQGASSGWMYSVNGVTPMTSCANYVLSNGDNVVWYYVTG